MEANTQNLYKLTNMGLRILYNIHLYVPRHQCGGEHYVHNINKYLISKGHKIRVVLNQAVMHDVAVPYVFDGVEVHGPMGTMDQYLWADVIITHLDYTQHTIQLGHVLRRPVINIIHNSHRYSSVENAFRDNYCIYNSEWIHQELHYDHPSMVFTPPCDWRHYDMGMDTSKNEFITLINLDENKGGRILQKLAAAMPNKKFLGITGSYSEPWQIGQVTNQPKNVTIWPKQIDIRNVYRKTRILLMPSRYESWGMTATEAMANGIPVICTPTNGLKENCNYAGIYVDERLPLVRDLNTSNILKDDSDIYDIKPIIKAINKLDNDKGYYKKFSELGRDRSRELDPINQLPILEDFIIGAVRQSRKQKVG